MKIIIRTEEDLLKVRPRYLRLWKAAGGRRLTKAECRWVRECSDALGIYRREYEGKIPVDQSVIEG